MTDYLLKFSSMEAAGQFGVASGFASISEDGEIKSNIASHEHALCIIGEHFIGGSEDEPAVGDKQWWILFRDLVGIPVPKEAEQFIHWSSASGEPRPDDKFTPQAFWA